MLSIASPNGKIYQMEEEPETFKELALILLEASRYTPPLTGFLKRATKKIDISEEELESYREIDPNKVDDRVHYYYKDLKEIAELKGLMDERENTWETFLDACLLLGYDQRFFKVTPSSDRPGESSSPALTDRIADYRGSLYFPSIYTDPCTRFGSMVEGIAHVLYSGLSNVAEA